jgi:hypothetical protein
MDTLGIVAAVLVIGVLVALTWYSLWRLLTLPLKQWEMEDEAEELLRKAGKPPAQRDQ